MSSLILQGYSLGNIITQGLYAGAELFVAAIIVEDGSGVDDANSYVTIEEARAYATARNKAALFADFDNAQAAVLRAADYLQAIAVFQGLPVFADQGMLWPRTGVYLNGGLFSSSAIPANLKKAQIELAMIVASGVDLYPLNNGKFAIQETVGPITTKYSDKIGFGAPDLSYIDMLLLGLIGSAGRLRTYRV